MGPVFGIRTTGRIDPVYLYPAKTTTQNPTLCFGEEDRIRIFRFEAGVEAFAGKSEAGCRRSLQVLENLHNQLGRENVDTGFNSF